MNRGRAIAGAAVAIAAVAALSLARTHSSQIPQIPAAHSPWKVLNDCVYVSDESNDGDSFHVSAGGKQYFFRLYFVDAPETDADFKDRVAEQARYFGITTEQVIQVGRLAKGFTREKLGQPFSVRTCFQDAFGRSRMQRYYAMAQTTTGDLGEQLIENGLARIHGASASPVGLPSANVEWQKLNQLEIDARAEAVGSWGVKFGRMMARSEKSKNRAPVDPFDAFIHSESAQLSAPAGSTTATTTDVVDADTNPRPFSQPAPMFSPARAVRVTKRAASSDEIVSINPRKFNINTATREELEELPGIGPVLAHRIIAARPFKSADELRKVKGIGESRYGKLRPYFE